jgi:CHRD domain
MQRLIACFVIACATVVLSASVASAKNGHGTMCVLHAKLAAKNETPAPGTTSTAKGHTLIKVREDGTIEFKTTINNKNHETFNMGHIHQAPVGVAGPVVVPLFVPPAPATSARHIKQRGTATPNAGTTGANLCQNASAYYVNYHTTTFPNGAIRGQLH